METAEDHWSSINLALEAAGHKLRRDEDGSIDIFVMDADHHNGPGCELCHESWCHHCLTLDRIEPCPGPGPYEKAERERELAELARLKAKYEGKES